MASKNEWIAFKVDPGMSPCTFDQQEQLITVVLQGKHEETHLNALFRLGTFGISVSVDVSSGQGYFERRDIIMVPTASVAANRRLVQISGAWPTFSINLLARTEAEARRLQEDLEMIALSMIRSLHLSIPRDVPVLTLNPIHDRKHLGVQKAAFLGDFILGGYVLVSDMVNKDHPALEGDYTSVNSPPRFSLYWAELRGDYETKGTVCFYFYSSHSSNAMFAEFEIFPDDQGIELNGNVLKLKGCEPNGGLKNKWEVPTDQYTIFRTAEEAELWVRLAMAARNPGHSHRRLRGCDIKSQEATCVRQVCAGIQNLFDSAGGPRTPQLLDDSKSLFPPKSNALPMDKVAVEARAKDAKVNDEITRILEGEESYANIFMIPLDDDM